jgi:hypothetical protein
MKSAAINYATMLGITAIAGSQQYIGKGNQIQRFPLGSQRNTGTKLIKRNSKRQKR